MTQPLDAATDHHLGRLLDELHVEFGGELESQQIDEVMKDSVERVVSSAEISSFVPLMAYRFARERLKAIKRAGGGGTPGSWDVVFVSLSGGGRGQIAAALTALLSERRVSVHSAGTAVQGRIDPGVRAVIEELGVGSDDAFARPVTDEVLHAADVIVTMGNSVGLVDIPEGIRHEAWRVGDPVGASTAEINRVRADIEYRVLALLNDLGVPTVDELSSSADREESKALASSSTAP